MFSDASFPRAIAALFLMRSSVSTRSLLRYGIELGSAMVSDASLPRAIAAFPRTRSSIS